MLLPPRREHVGLKPSFLLPARRHLALIKETAAAAPICPRHADGNGPSAAGKMRGLTPKTAMAQTKDEDNWVAARIMTRLPRAIGNIAAWITTIDFAAAARCNSIRRFAAALASGLRGWLTSTKIPTPRSTLLQLLAGARARMTLVGDDDQSIYGWRGATLDNLRRLPQDYPELKVIKLEQNYRSTGAILQAANQLIAGNPKLFEKKLWSELGVGEAVQALACDHEEHEAERMAARWLTLRAANPSLRWRDMAVLCANHQSRPLEQALRRARIPYKVSGGQSF